VTLLSVHNVVAAYGKAVAINRISLSVEDGEIVTLIGANGAGKSTLMKVIMGLVPVLAGEIEFDGRPLTGLQTYEIARLGIAYVPEGRGILHGLSVRENLRLGAFSRSWNAETRGDLDGVLARFPILTERFEQTAGTLSGGEQQMLVIGRALMSKPRLLLLDEPSLGLAPVIAAQIFQIIATLNEQGTPVLLVEQNARAALKLARRGYVLESGRITQEGSNLSDDPRVQEAYLGMQPLTTD
jgi:branched-chain amino acid transport system ATP-binding protein